LAIRHAVDQVKNIHYEYKDEIDDLFEGGIVQSWFLEPTTCGAFVYYDAYSRGLLTLLAKSEGDDRVFFSGEGISVTHGWIQGAVESGLTAALGVYASFHKKSE